MSREIVAAPIGKVVDHRNHDTLDNRKKNLRVCSRQENNANAQKRPGTSSRYKGVCWHAMSKKWAAQIDFNRKRCNLGLFAKEQTAARVYDAAAKKIHGEFAFLNFP